MGFPMIGAKHPDTLKAKGTHILSICDARSEEAQRLSLECERVTTERLRYLANHRQEMQPLELKLHRINAALSDLNSRSSAAQYLFQSKKRRLSIEQENLLEQIATISGKSKRFLHELWEDYRYHVERLERKFKKRDLILENVTTTIGRGVLAQRLGGDTTYTGTVNYTALGSDNTAADVSDATLGTEVYRKAISSGTDAANIAYLETFFSASETSGTYEEYGNFIDGAAGADTGQLFNRFVSSITKSLTETLNVQSIITFNDA